MPPIVIGTAAYRIRTSQRTGRWCAYAVRADTGDRYGTDFTADSEPQAVAAVTAWLEWQYDHGAALATLQDAERDYHRSIASELCATAAADRAATRQARRDALDRLAAARARLDAVRAKRPL